MGKKIIILGISLLLAVQLYPQEKPDRIVLDQETYQLYLEQNWKKLIDRGQLALDHGYDYYYLRMRLGLAWFALGRYEKARAQFLAALGFSAGDPSAGYYLYYACLHSGRTGEARRLLNTLPDRQREEMKVPEKYSLSGILAEGGVFTNHSESALKDSLPAGPYVNSYFSKNMYYLNLSGGVNLGYSSNLTFSVNRFSSNNKQYIYTDGNLMDFDHTSSQNGIYLKYLYHFPHSWYAGVAYHGIQGTFSYSYPKVTQSGAYTFQTYRDNYSQKYAGGFLGKHLNCFDARLQFSLNDFWQENYFQSGISLFYYPLGSVDYYLNAGYDRMFAGDSNGNTEEAWKFEAGVKLFKGFYLTGNHVFGSLANWADANGYYLFNTVSPIRSRSGVRLLVTRLSPHLQISVTGYYQNRDHQATINQVDGSTTTATQKYSTTSIFGGISWIF